MTYTDYLQQLLCAVAPLLAARVSATVEVLT